jgi:hypothetical protein
VHDLKRGDLSIDDLPDHLPKGLCGYLPGKPGTVEA